MERIMKESAETQKSLESNIRELFPSASAAIVWGSSGEDFIPGVSDVDLLIVSSDDADVRSKLKLLCDAQSGVDVDALYLSRDELAKGIFRCVAFGRDYELHKFDLYRIKSQGRVLFGDPHALESFPDVSLAAALADVAPHIREVFIPELQEKLREAHDTTQFLKENLDRLLVVARTMCSMETKEYASKIYALEYLKREYPNFGDLLEHLRQLYLRQPQSDEPVPVRSIRSFLEFAQQAIGK